MSNRILLVEDDERIRASMRLALEDEGYEVDEAGSGEVGLERFAEQPADVVLIDLMLPGMDGFECCRQLRRTSAVPVIMVTARTDTHDVVAGLEAGADDYVTKPFVAKELAARIRALLRRARSVDDPRRALLRRRRGASRRGHGASARARRSTAPAPSSVCCASWPPTRARSSAGSSSSTGSGATTTSATDGWSTSTSGGCAPRSRPTPPIPVTSSPCEGWATSWPPEDRHARIGARRRRPLGRRRATSTTHRRKRPWSNLGLRSRVTVTFGLGALALSATMAGLTYFTARQFILHERETAILRQAYVNASLARSSLRSANPNITQLLASLDTVPGSRSVLELKGQWYATSISVGENAIPLPAANPGAVGHARHPTLRAGRHARRWWSACPIPSVERVVLRGLLPRRPEPDPAHPGPGPGRRRPVDHRRRARSIGRWASGRALRPLAQVSRAAETVAGGSLDTRLLAEGDPELSALASSFNRMTDALQERIDHEVRFTADVSHELRSPLTTLGHVAGRARVAPRRAAAAQPSRPRPVERGAPPLPADGRRPPRDQPRRHRLGRAVARRGRGG